MNKINTGGTAFPTVDANRDADYGTRGMTLRQYYAAKALPACIQFTDRERWEWCVKRAFAIADEMINFEEQGK